MLRIKNLDKTFNQLKVFENINVEILKGELLGVVGSNGAGKTTLLNLIMSNLDFEGEILIEGIPNYEYLSKYRDNILLLPDEIFIYEFLTGIEFIKFILDLKKIPFSKVEKSVEILLQLFNLSERSNSLIKEYSHGMKQKIALISVLIQSPKILLLDEPVSGLDAISLIVLKKILISMSKRGITIIFTTHILDFVENLCNSIIVINDKKAIRIDDINKMERKEIENKFIQITGKEIDLKIEELGLNEV